MDSNVNNQDAGLPISKPVGMCRGLRASVVFDSGPMNSSEHRLKIMIPGIKRQEARRKCFDGQQ